MHISLSKSPSSALAFFYFRTYNELCGSILISLCSFCRKLERQAIYDSPCKNEAGTAEVLGTWTPLLVQVASELSTEASKIDSKW